MIPRSRRRYSQSPSCPPGWTWLLAGILIGMFLSFLFYLQEIDSSVPVEPEKVVAAAVEEKKPPTEATSSSLTPRFEFYDILPQSESHLPVQVQAVSEVVEVEPSPAPTVVKTVTSTPTPTVNNTQHASNAQVLQVGAFRDAQEAEGLKAHLALLGVRAQVRASTVDSSGVWHRVEVGPVRNFAQLERLQTKLRAHNIAFIVQTTD